MQVSREQFDAAVTALGLDPATTESVNLSPDWIRVVHRNQAVTSVPVSAPAPDDEAPASPSGEDDGAGAVDAGQPLDEGPRSVAHT